jgi:MoaA/NifB/PqqE/SkfB family radical SAM enzyme
MYNLKDIKQLHLEITAKCQAKCPQCARRLGGGPINPFIDSFDEIDLISFKEWFPESFLKNLTYVLLNGNLGDPIIAQDCLQIVEYIRSVNNEAYIQLNTNGSARTIAWWKKLAQYKIHVVFGIDGLEDTHSIYRIGTNYNNILENAKAYIDEGGNASWHMIVFQHNEHQIEQCRETSIQYGFNEFVYKHTSRFVTEYENVIDEEGKLLYKIYPSSKSKKNQIVQQNADLNNCVIDCKAKKFNQIYVSASGKVLPCCWLETNFKPQVFETRIDYVTRISEYPNLKTATFEEIFDSGFFNKISDTWETNNKLADCKMNCGNFDSFNIQFDQKI